MHTITPPHWNQESAEQQCLASARAKFHHFASFPDVTLDDLVQIAMEAALRARETYETGHGTKWETWISMHAARRIIDFRRQRMAQQRREQVPRVFAESVENIGDRLIDVSQRAMDAAEKMLPDYSAPQSPHRFRLPQLAACLIVRDHLKTSYRGVVLAIAASPEARERMGLLRRVPDATTLHKAESAIRRVVRNLRKKKYGTDPKRVTREDQASLP